MKRGTLSGKIPPFSASYSIDLRNPVMDREKDFTPVRGKIILPRDT